MTVPRDETTDTVDMTPTPGGTLRIWAHILASAMANMPGKVLPVASMNYRTAKADRAKTLVASVIDDLNENGTRLLKAEREKGA